MKNQLTLLFTALQFYTRIPAPSWVVYRPENLSLAIRYLPFVGWIVGAATGSVWVIGAYLTNVDIGILFSLVASILITGAFHEDGFADVCDGFGGGWTKDKILEIMKDSRVGTHGSVGLILILALKFLLLQRLASHNGDFLTLILALVSGHAWSRLMPAFVIFTLPYAREGDDSKSKPVAQAVSHFTILIATFFAVIPIGILGYYSGAPSIIFTLILPGFITYFLARYFMKWVGGYTGDCLGAIQQVSEIAFYLSLTILWKFI